MAIDDGTGRDRERKRKPKPEPERVLIPLQVLKGESFGSELARLLSPMDVVVLGYHVVPDQTPPDQMRNQFEKQATKALDTVVEAIVEAGGTASKRLVFTHDAAGTVDRIAEDVGATAILESNPVGDVDSLLVPLRSETGATGIAEFVVTLRADRDIDVTLFAAARAEQAEDATAIVEAARRELLTGGLPESALRTDIRTTTTPVQAIADAAVEHDVVVLGDREPDWRSLVFGDLADRVADESLGPVIIVRQQI